MAHTFVWGSNASALWGSKAAASWDDPANWIDTTTGEDPASATPGSTDLVTINDTGLSGHIITGVGTCASLTNNGATSLQGKFTTGALVLSGLEVKHRPSLQ